MTTYVLNGIFLDETGDGTILDIAPSRLEAVVPDGVTAFSTAVFGANNEGEPLLRLVIDDNDVLLNGATIWGNFALDLQFVDVTDGASGAMTVVANIFDNSSNQSHIFRIGGAPFPDGAFASPASATSFLDNAGIELVAPDGPFGPGAIRSLPNLPDVQVAQEDFVIDNRNDVTPDRAYSLGRADDVYDAGFGNDTIDGGAGFDTVFYEFANATPIRANLTDAVIDGIAPGTVVKNSGIDTIRSFENLLASQFDDVVYLPRGAGFVFDRAGDDRIVASEGGTLFRVGSGADEYVGGTGFDQLIFEDDSFDRAGLISRGAEVTMTGTGEGTAIDGWGFTDTFSGMGQILGTSLADSMVGAGGRDRFEGGAGADSLSGGDADDVLVGGGGGDVLEGGAGRDAFAFLTTDQAGAARITDFGEDDLLVFDDRFFGLGDEGFDIRAASAQQISAALRTGLVDYDPSTGALAIDADGRGGAAAPEPVVVIDGGPILGLGDIVLI